VSDETQTVKTSLGVWMVISAGLLAIPVGLIGYRWLERVNTERIGFTQRVSTPGVTVRRACAERALTERFGRRQVRAFDDAVLVQLPAIQYQRTPEKMHIVVRGATGGNALIIDTAFYKERPVVSRYDEVISGAMSEVVDTIVRGCAPDASESVRAGWSAQCTRGPNFTRACPTLRPGATQPADTKIAVVRD
jgi:hypothetical protein